MTYSNINVTLPTIEVREYEDASGRSPYQRWFFKLNAVAAAKIAVALTRLAEGNTSNLKGIGGGVCELKVNYGPGYRVYLGQDGPRLVIMLGGGTKATQRADIKKAKEIWLEYKQRKKAES